MANQVGAMEWVSGRDLEKDTKGDRSVNKERRSQARGYPIVQTSPGPDRPDKRKLVSVISKTIKEKEACLKSVSWKRSTAEVDKLTGEVARDEKQKWRNITEIDKHEKAIQSLGVEINTKTDKARNLIAGVRHTTEEKIDEAVSELELKLCSRDFSLEEERKLRQEIDSLIKSKQPLRDFHLLKEETGNMRKKQEALRTQKEALQQDNIELRKRISENKDLVAKKKAELEESKKEALALQTQLEKEINDLKKQRKQLHIEYRVRQQFHSQAVAAERRRGRGQMESRKGDRLYRKIPPRPPPAYHQKIRDCEALTGYLHKLHTPSDTAPSPSPHRPQVDQSSLAAEKLGEFLPRKGEEEGGAVLIPASSRKKSKRDKRRHTTSSKAAGRTLNHHALTLRQFTNIGLDPPMTSSDIEDVLDRLQERLEFFTIKTQPSDTGLESRDSGVALSSTLSTPLSASVESLVLLPSTLLPFPSGSSGGLTPELVKTDSESD